jgi:hypothetical protein
MGVKVKSFMAGAVFALVLAGLGLGVYAAASGGIKSVAFNDIKISYNGEEIDISSNPMISVLQEGAAGAANYMPVREVLSAMGYGIAWENAGEDGRPSVLILSKDYLESSTDWICFADVLAIINELPDALEREYFLNKIYYDETRRAVHVVFDTRHEWDLCTAVIDGEVYIDSEDFKNFSSLFIPEEMTQKLKECVPWYMLIPR